MTAPAERPNAPDQPDRAAGSGGPAGTAPVPLLRDPAELELYKLAVEMADRASARRALANTFFLTVNTGLVALLGARHVRWYVAAAGIVFALVWWWLLQTYRQLSSAKFKVINDIETRLPVQPFSEEWTHLQS